MKKTLLLLALTLILFAPGARSQGCMEPVKGDGAQIIGYIQPQFEYTFKGKDNKDNLMDYSTFKFNRARFGITGSIPYDFEYYVLMETSSFLSQGGYPYLLDGFISYKRLGHWAKLSFGQFKSPVSLELATPCNGLYTIKRSRVVDDLTAPNRDLGLMIMGASDSLELFGWKTYNLLKYSLAITNGTGLNVSDKNRGKNFSGRVVLSPLPFLSLGASYLYGLQKDVDSLYDNTDARTRYGFDAEIRYRNFLLQGEYLYGKDEGSFTTGGGCGGGGVTYPGPIERAGYWAMLAYMTPWNLQAVAKYESYDSDINSEDDPIFDLYSTATFGLNYFFNDWTRLQINYMMNTEDVLEQKNDGLYVQVQIKIK